MAISSDASGMNDVEADAILARLAPHWEAKLEHDGKVIDHILEVISFNLRGGVQRCRRCDNAAALPAVLCDTCTRKHRAMNKTRAAA